MFRDIQPGELKVAHAITEGVTAAELRESRRGLCPYCKTALVLAFARDRESIHCPDCGFPNREQETP